MWLAFVGLKMPAVTEIWRLYLRRFAIDHWYRFAKNSLHWTVPAFSTPAQCDRWSDLMPIVTLAIMVGPSLGGATPSAVAEISGQTHPWAGSSIFWKHFSPVRHTSSSSQTAR
jgi:hypothetical protein